MTLLELKNSLKRYPPDMHDMAVIVSFSRDNQRQMEPLCFIGYLPLTGKECIVLGTLTEVQRMVENGELEKPEGYIDPEAM